MSSKYLLVQPCLVHSSPHPIRLYLSPSKFSWPCLLPARCSLPEPKCSVPCLTCFHDPTNHNYYSRPVLYKPTCDLPNCQFPHFTSLPYQPVVRSSRPPGVCSPQARTERTTAPSCSPSSAHDPHPSALLQGFERAHRILWLAATSEYYS
jgi:hypothetical protein